MVNSVIVIVIAIVVQVQVQAKVSLLPLSCGRRCHHRHHAECGGGGCGHVHHGHVIDTGHGYRVAHARRRRHPGGGGHNVDTGGEWSKAWW